MSNSSFDTLPLSSSELENLATLNYKEMTDIQQKSLPVILQGHDLIAQAKTGSGKTAAFGIGLLHRLNGTLFQTQSLVICPTRELADQVANELQRLAKAFPNTKIITLCGGKPMGGQLASLERPAHIVVGTPGRLLKHLNKGTLKLNHLSTLVLDEADRMLDMGFIDDIKLIIELSPSSRQTLLFSATYPDEIKSISQSVQKNPVEVQVESRHDDSQIKQVFYELDGVTREQALLNVLSHYQPTSGIVFCNRKQQCDEVAQFLSQQNISAKALHGDLDQNQRDLVLTQFTNKSCCFLVATDVAARGLDIKDLPLVVNFELSYDAEVHIHRIGRTGRAGSTGLAVSLYQQSEISKIVAIEDESQQSILMEKVSQLSPKNHFMLKPEMVTLCINGGRKDKLGAGDILGALTADGKVKGADIGKIDRFDRLTYVAIQRKSSQEALNILANGKIKGRLFKARLIK